MHYTPLTAGESHAVLWSRGIALPIGLLSFSFLIVGNLSWRYRGLPEAFVPLLIPLIISMFFNATIFIIVLHSNLRIKVAACPPRLLIVPSDLVLICGLIIGALFSYSTMVTFVLAIMLASLHIVGSVVAFIAGTRGSKEVTPVEQGNSEQV